MSSVETCYDEHNLEVEDEGKMPCKEEHHLDMVWRPEHGVENIMTHQLTAESGFWIVTGLAAIGRWSLLPSVSPSRQPTATFGGVSWRRRASRKQGGATVRKASCQVGKVAVRGSGRFHQSSTNTCSLSVKLQFRFINMRFRKLNLAFNCFDSEFRCFKFEFICLKWSSAWLNCA